MLGALVLNFTEQQRIIPFWQRCCSESQEEILYCALKDGDTLQGQLRRERENEKQALVVAAWLGAAPFLCFRDKT